MSTTSIIMLAGNPNVGKSTVFNALTGLRQHTGNWSGKTVGIAQGVFNYKSKEYTLVDLPGTYSLMAHSAEEEVARDSILFGGADAVIVVCDATCLERNLNLVLQVIEITPHVVVCVNLMDEAEKKGIVIDLEKLEKSLGVPVIGSAARSKKGLERLISVIASTNSHSQPETAKKFYPEPVEQAASILEQALNPLLNGRLNSRWLAIRLLENETSLYKELNQYLGCNPAEDENVIIALSEARSVLKKSGTSTAILKDIIISAIIKKAEQISHETVSYLNNDFNSFDRKLDKILTGKLTGIPIMLALLWIVFWITLTGANIPSQLLSDGLFWIQDILTELFYRYGASDWLHGLLVLGMYRVLAWVVSVMLPPMAIFFPLFTLLEDFGYLPRIAFNLDHQFKRACACGKQALTMCMGFGCNAAGVVGCRIIDSPRERLIAVMTNSLVPCNGRFPTLIAIISMFFIGTSTGWFQSLLSTVMLAGFIILGVFSTLAISKILSKTILKGEPSSFTLELPPYRKPQIGKVIIRSLLDRTIYVLGRAAVMAAPAGMLIWLLANTQAGDMSLLMYLSGFLDPFARLMGLDGVILLAFILAFPANEIVVPIIIMSYMLTGSISEIGNLNELKALLVQNGWTTITAVSTMLFCLFHWPCSTTCLTIKKETRSLKWTALSFIIPTLMGFTVCFLFATVSRIMLLYR